jgi:hypothetical protein
MTMTTEQSLVLYDADAIIKKSEAVAKEYITSNTDPEAPRWRLSFQVGYLTGSINNLCAYIKFLEGELNEANAKIDRLTR